ncbi:hypothetical protein DBR32_06920 [Taibaiella sp. KBW10]|uniref:T9SS type A sorting domain-containing protein n=1 Tax=Taibaiella sp. KBW10 TaxID=2153357 RepID=UPI000F5AEDAE|nr:T9SS type A sorting domain-containing protein [Taibaiella sp. KBW10]RQO31673.1 hypothetical protein DBR32_06920 [Taibaiella sp. KBW10]
MRQFNFFPCLCTGILFLSTYNAGAQCVPALQVEKVTPSTNFYDFNGAAADGNIAVTAIPGATGWTGGGTGTIYAGSTGTQFVTDNNVAQTVTRSVTNANLTGSGALVTLVMTGSDGNPVAGSLPASFEVLYNGVTYARLRTANNTTTNVTVTALASATVSPASFVPGTMTTISLTLPTTIPNNGNLQLRFVADAGGHGDDYTVQSVSFKACPALIRGSIFNDANGTTGGVNGTATGGSGSSAGQLYVNLVDGSGNVVGTAAVQADGSYSVPASISGSFTARLSTVQGTVGAAAPAASLPTGWVNVSESDGSANGGIAVTVADAITNTNIAGNDFGINRLPQTFPVTNTVNGSPGTSVNISTAPMRGSDPEVNSGTQQNWTAVKITSLPTNGFILKVNGVAITVIDPNITYDPATLSIVAGPTTAGGTTTSSFGYAAVDAAGSVDQSPSTYTLNYSFPLPVTIVSFKASVQADCGVQLLWTSGAEDQFKKFIVEKSGNGTDFKAIREVSAKGAQSQYGFTDHSTGQGKQFYRLKLVDNDNSYAYSKVLSLALNCAGEIKVFPTVTASILTVEGVQSGDLLKVIDASGRVIMEQYATNNTSQLNLKSLNAGNYFIQISRNEVSQFFKVVKL